MRKKRGAAHPRRAREAEARQVAPGARGGRGYPTVAALLAAGGLALVGCQDPECSASSSDELKSHGGRGLERLADLDVEGGFREIGVGLGIAPHPYAPMMAGEMIAPVPTVPPTPTGPELQVEDEEPL